MQNTIPLLFSSPSLILFPPLRTNPSKPSLFRLRYSGSTSSRKVPGLRYKFVRYTMMHSLVSSVP